MRRICNKTCEHFFEEYSHHPHCAQYTETCAISGSIRKDRKCIYNGNKAIQIALYRKEKKEWRDIEKSIRENE